MRKGSRAERFFEAGLEEYKLVRYGEESQLLAAIAVMVAEATAKEKPAKKEKLPFDAKAFHKHMLEHLPGAFDYSTPDARWWPRLNRDIRSLGLQLEFLDKFVTWWKEGRPAAKGWADLPFRFCVDNFRNWAAEANSDKSEWETPTTGGGKFVRSG